jgi:hypothetical protein
MGGLRGSRMKVGVLLLIHDKRRGERGMVGEEIVVDSGEGW